MEIGNAWPTSIGVTWDSTYLSGGASFYDIRMRPGAAPVILTVASSDSSVIALDNGQISFGPGDSSKSLALKAVGVGKATITLGVPAGSVDPGLARRSGEVEVTLRALNVICGGTDIGKDTQQSCSVSLPADVTLTATSSQLSSLLITADPTVKGSAQATLKGYGTFYLQSPIDSGTAEVTFSAPNYSMRR